jgi:arabinose-5-phosphate isomerase
LAIITLQIVKKIAKLQNHSVNINDLIVKTAQNTIEIETNTLQNLLNTIDDSFVQTVRSILESRGRLIVTGVGKSALIGQKIVSTLNSTGTPAIFMHAGDAIHGDLGMIMSEDMVLCISKSGLTPEIKILIPLLKSRNATIIAMVADQNSLLAKAAHFVLHTPVEKEADPNNLAPTASTTAQVAMGDALATALIAARGFSAEDFARHHPGGTLGKQMYLTVETLYKNNERPAVSPADNLSAVILEITSKRLGAAVVENEQKKALGIITDGDLRRMLNQDSANLPQITASQIMNPQPKIIHPRLLAVNALEIMRKNSITQLIVCEKNNTYLGIVHLHDLLREGII